MKFLHTADLHYGAAPDAKRPWGRERAQAVKDGFARVISACRNENIDMLLIAGGLFDDGCTAEEFNEVNRAFAGIPKTEVYVLAGAEGSKAAGADDDGFEWAPNVKYCPQSSTEIPECGILLARNEEIKENEIPKTYSYAAYGGAHKTHVYNAGKAVNAGSPVPMGPADAGKHGFYIGEINDGKLTALKFVMISDVRYITLVVNVTPVSTCEEVKKTLRAEMKRRGEKNIYTVKLCGNCGPDAAFDLEELKYEFRVDEIYNKTEARYDYVRIFRDHSSDMVGFFVKEMNTENKSELQKKALNYGVDALLRTADERL